MSNYDNEYQNQIPEQNLKQSGVTETPNFKNISSQQILSENSNQRVSSFKIPSHKKRQNKSLLNNEIDSLKKQLANMKNKYLAEKQKAEYNQQEQQKIKQEIEIYKQKLTVADNNDNQLVETIQEISKENQQLKKDNQKLQEQCISQASQNLLNKSTIENLKQKIMQQSKLFERSQTDLKQSKELNERIKLNRFDFKDDMQESQLLNQNLEFFEPEGENILAQSFGPKKFYQSQDKSQSVSQLYDDNYQQQCEKSYHYIEQYLSQLLKQNKENDEVIKKYEQQIESLKQVIEKKDYLIDQYSNKFFLYVQQINEQQRQQMNTNLYEDLDLVDDKLDSEDELKDIMSEQSQKQIQNNTAIQIQQTPLLTTKDPRNYKTISKIPKSKSQLDDSNDIKAKSLLKDFEYQQNESYEKFKLFKSPNERNYSEINIQNQQYSQKSSFELQKSKNQSYSQNILNLDNLDIYEYIQYLKNYYREQINSLKVKIECFTHLNQKINYMLDIFLDDKQQDDLSLSFEQLANFQVEEDYENLMTQKTFDYFKNKNRILCQKIYELNEIYTRNLVLNQFEILRDVFDQIKNTNLIVPFIKEQIQKKIYGIQSDIYDERKQDQVLSDLSELKGKVISFLSSNSLKEIDHARRSVQKEDYEKLSSLKKEIKITKINQEFLRKYLKNIQILIINEQEDVLVYMKTSVRKIKTEIKNFQNDHILLITEIQNIDQFGDSFSILKQIRKNEKKQYNLTSQIYRFFWSSIKRISNTENFKLSDQIIKLQIKSLNKHLYTINKELEQNNFKKTPQNFQNQQIFENYKDEDINEVFKSRAQNHLVNPFDFLFTQDIYTLKFFISILNHFLSPKVNQFLYRYFNK